MRKFVSNDADDCEKKFRETVNIKVVCYSNLFTVFFSVGGVQTADECQQREKTV